MPYFTGRRYVRSVSILKYGANRESAAGFTGSSRDRNISDLKNGRQGETLTIGAAASRRQSERALPKQMRLRRKRQAKTPARSQKNRDKVTLGNAANLLSRPAVEACDFVHRPMVDPLGDGNDSPGTLARKLFSLK